MTTTGQKIKAERCLVAACVTISFHGSNHANTKVWIATLAEILPDCTDCSPALEKIRDSAAELVEAFAKPGATTKRSGRGSMAVARLRRIVEEYYQLAAGGQYEAWKALKAPPRP